LSLFMLANVSAPAESGFNFVLHTVNTQAQNDKVKIKKEDLPEAAKKTLGGDSFKGWAIVRVYKVGNEEFEVELRKGSAFQTIQFDKDGKLK